MKTGIVTKDGVTEAIKTPNSFKKICKLFFTSNDTSLYVHFYSKTEIYYYKRTDSQRGLFKVRAEGVEIPFVELVTERESVPSPEDGFRERNPHVRKDSPLFFKLASS